MRHMPLALTLFLFTLPAQAGNFGFPLACTPGQDCFVQQYPDTDPGPDASDPFCGGATYDGHQGTDIRVRSLIDMRAGIDVLAVTDGTVLRTRDEMPDQLVTSEAGAQAIADRECGNGLVLDLGEGTTVQYCHMRENSLTVSPGDSVKKADILGQLGASGMAQFPHVHVQVIRNDSLLDPTTGIPLADGCNATSDPSETLWDEQAAPVFFAPRAQLLDAGFSTGPVAGDDLVVNGPPPVPTTNDSALVAWAWLIDLNQGDVISLQLIGPNGEIAANQLDPLDRAKATYTAFAGERMSVGPGTYQMQVQVLRNGEPVIDQSRELVLD